MKCPTMCSTSLMLMLVVALVVVFVMYLRCRKSCPLELKQFSMQQTKLAVTGLRYPFSLPPLPYASNGLEPYIDEATMIIHHTKHHQAYINNANAALEKFPDWTGKPPEDVVKHLSQVPEEIRTEIGRAHV